ncbi:MAG: hypothetical protein QFX35_05580 [Candidatus Verstraetearchaeota archaeon]|nr:hypothetical protein [Candidatus Verstraetearchaeota archaeon]
MSPELQDVVEGMLSGTAVPSSDGLSGCVSGEFGLERDELTRCCITGIGPERAETAMELVLRCSEAGEKVFVMDMTGNYLSLVGYLPSLYVYRVGRNLPISPFSSSRKGFPELVAAAVQAVLGISKDERAHLERALQLSLSQGMASPRISEILEELLQIEAESHPRQGASIDSLRNALWELQEFDKQTQQKEVQAPALIDLSKGCSIRAARLAAIDIFLNLEPFDATAVVIDPADRVFSKEGPDDLQHALELSADGLAKKGAFLIMATSTSSNLPRWVTDTLSSEIKCGSVRGCLDIFRSQCESKCHERVCPKREKRPSLLSAALYEGKPLLVVSRYSEGAYAVRVRRTEFKPITDADLERHMKTLGENFEAQGGCRKRTMLLERIFTDKSMQKTAMDLLVLIRGGRVPVDAIMKQRSSALRRVVRTLSKYFLIVESADGNGINWYKLTKAGERALEEGGDADEGEVRV